MRQAFRSESTSEGLAAARRFDVRRHVPPDLGIVTPTWHRFWMVGAVCCALAIVLVSVVAQTATASQHTSATPNPCPDWTQEDVEADPAGDWDGDSAANADDDLPCTPTPDVPASPCPVWNAAERTANPTLDWDNDGLINSEDPDPCRTETESLGGPCPVWNAAERAANPTLDWDSDGLINSEDPDPCRTESQDGRCPVWNPQTIAADPIGDWDGDGLSNAADDDACVDNRIESLLTRSASEEFPRAVIVVIVFALALAGVVALTLLRPDPDSMIAVDDRR